MKFNRKLSKFKGDYVVVGCGHKFSRKFCHACFYHHNINKFYTIDINPNMNPDFITRLEYPLPDEFYNRFELTILEHLPYWAYTKKSKGFKNALAMTKDNGLIVIVGNPREKIFRDSFKDLKYIECNAADPELGIHIVIIPKNQERSIEDIRKQFTSLPLTKRFTSTPIADFDFHQLKSDDLSSELQNHAAWDVGRSLIPTINAMKEYGKKLKKIDAEKSLVVVNLANKLLKLTRALAKDKNLTATTIQQFKSDFNDALHSQDKAMKQHIKQWKPIVLNIAIALSGIGLFVIAGKLIHSKVTNNHFYFFHQGTRTRRQKLVTVMDNRLNGIVRKWDEIVEIEQPQPAPTR